MGFINGVVWAVEISSRQDFGFNLVIQVEGKVMSFAQLMAGQCVK
jgi:hypothetical protein